MARGLALVNGVGKALPIGLWLANHSGCSAGRYGVNRPLNN